MADSEKKTIISVFAHPDDELGVIGTLANHVDAGDNVLMAWTTYGELTTLLPELSSTEIKRERERHTQEISKIVGANESVILGMKDGHIENSREQRLSLAKFYAKEKPDAILTWGFNNSDSDHKNTGIMALEAIKFARITKIIEMEPHRKNVQFLSYYEPENLSKTKYIDITDNFSKVMEAYQFYAEIYDWKEFKDWLTIRRRNHGLESNCKYAEKFNVRFDYTKPKKTIF